ncbi:MAG TPA: hypothetical protein VJM50_18210 [Pyrinomonadaceae bacterium]|nr:hypothetical protein [Pyrinomonadaceae bacterium]
MSSPVPVVAAFSAGLFTESRIGIVVLATPNTMFVNVGGTVLEVGFLAPFTGAAIVPPAAGTVVQVVRQDASWVATGRLIGTGSNVVVNPSFEDGPLGAQPVHWFSYDISGSSTATVVSIADAPSGDLAVRVFSGGAADHYLYSEPIPVNTGESWSLSAFVGGDYGGAPATAQARIDAMWFANSTDLFPTVSAPSTTVANQTNVPQYPPFTVLSGNATVPAATFFMRVALRSTLAAGQALLWDAASARRN